MSLNAAAMIRLVTLAVAAVVGTGCTHFANISEAPAADGTPTFVSSRAWEDGTPRTVVTERVYAQPERPCDLLKLQREYYDRTGNLEQRETDIETCGVVLTRVREQFDLGAAQVTRVVQTDTDRDGRFDVERSVTRELGSEQLAMLRNAVTR